MKVTQNATTKTNTNCEKTKLQFDSLKKKINIKYSISAAAVCNR